MAQCRSKLRESTEPVWKRIRTEDDGVRLFRKLWVNRTLYGWKDKDRRRARWLLSEIRRLRRIDPEAQQMGRLAQDKGNKAENRDTRAFREFLPPQYVRSKRLDEALDLKVGADYEVTWWWMPLLVQRKHAKAVRIRSAWNKLLKAMPDFAHTPLLHAEWSHCPYGHRRDLAIMFEQDFNYMYDSPTLDTQFHALIWSGAQLQIEKQWIEAEARAAHCRQTPALTICYAGLDTLVAFPWDVFIADYRTAVEAFGVEQPSVAGGASR